MPHITVNVSNAQGTNISASGNTTDPGIINAVLTVINELTSSATEVPVEPTAPATPPLPEPLPEVPGEAVEEVANDAAPQADAGTAAANGEVTE